MSLPTATKLRQGNIFTPVCQSFCSQGGACMAGVCMAGGMCVVGGHAWQGACVAGDVHGRGHAYQGLCMAWGCAWWGACMARSKCGRGVHGGGMCGIRCAWGACMAHPPTPHQILQVMGVCIAGGMHGRGHVWQGVCMACPPHCQILRDTVNEWVVRILLECILVFVLFVIVLHPFMNDINGIINYVSFTNHVGGTKLC